MFYRLMKTSIPVVCASIIVGCGGSGSTGSGINSDQTANEAVAQAVITEAMSAAPSTLTQALKDSIVYMYNEEKLAKDVYLDVYSVQNMRQLYNIATRSEVSHQEAVNELAQKYDLNITLYPDTDVPYDSAIEGYTSGEYTIAHIQELYEVLYTKGIQSPQDALEVGCMVEVTDINDLDIYVEQAIDSQAEDVLTVFNFLRDGSYSHYWAFDQGLKNIGITEGCCVLGADYCHSEYPQN